MDFRKKDDTVTRTLKDLSVSKDSDEIWAIGSVDEANAMVGLAKVHCDSETREMLSSIQKKMFHLGVEISSGEINIGERDVMEILELIENLEKKVKFPKRFIILEQNDVTAYLSIARATVRRAERWMVKLRKDGKIGENAVRWMNKLSYLLYLIILKELDGKFEAVSFDGSE